MLLGCHGVDVVGITTTADVGGARAGYVSHLLELSGRTDVPVVAGAGVSSTTGAVADPQPPDGRYWPRDLAPRPSPLEHAVDLLERSIDEGATVVAIGPLTNLAELERSRPGVLERSRVVMMGGWMKPPRDGLPPWGPEKDFNVQWDTAAVEVVAAHADLTLVPLDVAIEAHLRARDLPRLRASGALGALLARQAEAQADDWGMRDLPRHHPALPPDLLNFQWDAVASAAAVGWPGAGITRLRLSTTRDGDVLRFVRSDEERPLKVVRAIDAGVFGDVWLAAVEAAQRSGLGGSG